MTGRNWLAVASAEHVRTGRTGGFMQVCHGKATPLRLITPGDRVVYYSPTRTFRGKSRLQAFTAIGIVKPGAPYQVDMGNGFLPFRRGVHWLDGIEAPIRPLLGILDFSSSRRGRDWGHQLRLGLLPISDHDMQAIAALMHVELEAETPPFSSPAA